MLLQRPRHKPLHCPTHPLAHRPRLLLQHTPGLRPKPKPRPWPTHKRLLQRKPSLRLRLPQLRKHLPLQEPLHRHTPPQRHRQEPLRSQLPRQEPPLQLQLLPSPKHPLRLGLKLLLPPKRAHSLAHMLMPWPVPLLWLLLPPPRPRKPLPHLVPKHMQQLTPWLLP